MRKNKEQVLIEKETIIREVGGEKVEKVTIRVIINTEGKSRSIVFTPAKFKKFQTEVNRVKI